MVWTSRWSVSKNKAIFLFTACFLWTLPMVYCNPDMTGYYNPSRYTLNTQCFLIAQVAAGMCIAQRSSSAILAIRVI